MYIALIFAVLGFIEVFFGILGAMASDDMLRRQIGMMLIAHGLFTFAFSQILYLMWHALSSLKRIEYIMINKFQ